MGKQDAFQKPSLVFQGLQPLVRAPLSALLQEPASGQGPRWEQAARKCNILVSGSLVGEKNIFLRLFLKMVFQRDLVSGAHTEHGGTLPHDSARTAVVGRGAPHPASSMGEGRAGKGQHHRQW